MDSNAVLRLTETDGGGNSSELSTINVSSSTTTIGRSNEADISFGEDDQSVSRLQFEVSFSGGAPTLKNTGRNPVVYKNGRKQLAPGAQTNIVSGLEVVFREGKLRFDVDIPTAYCLKTKGAGGRAAFEIESNRKYTVGRSPECDITLNSSGVSRRHCKLEVESSEILNVHDLGSVNGVRRIIKGEVQEECSDIEVPCGEKFIIGDIECILEKEGKGSGSKKKIVLPVVIVLLLFIAAASVIVLKPDGKVQEDDHIENSSNGSTHQVDSSKNESDQSSGSIGTGDEPEDGEDHIDLEHQQNIDRIQTIIRNDKSFGQKADQLAVLAKEPAFKELKPVCEQLVEYYSQCELVKTLIGSLSQEYDQQKKKTRSSIEQMRFDFETSLDSKKLQAESRNLEALHTSVSGQLKRDSMTLEPSRKLTDEAGRLIENADEYEEKARSLSFIWTDLENSSFAAGKFDKREVLASIDTLYPDEGMGAEVCAQIDEIISYREQLSTAYEGLCGRLKSVLSNYTKNGVSEALVPERMDMKPLREALETTLPKYFTEPPPITVVSDYLYDQLEGIHPEWTNLEFLTYCGDWHSALEQKQRVFSRIDEVLPLMTQLIEEASLKCAADVNKGLTPYREIISRLESGEELGFHDADKLMRVYELCGAYLQHDLFCKLRKESEKEMKIVSADCLNQLYERLKKECFDGPMAPNDSEKYICVKNAKRILDTLDSADSLPADFETRIKEFRRWTETEYVKMETKLKKTNTQE